MSDIDDLRAKRDARRNQPGFKANVAAIEAHIARIEAAEQGFHFRSKETGQFVTDEYAAANPEHVEAI